MRPNPFRSLLLFGLIALLLFANSVFFAASADEAEAENLTKRCTMTSDLRSTAFIERMRDDNYESAQRFAEGVTVSLSWADDVPVRAVYLAFYYEPKPYLVRQYDADGNLLSETEGELLYNNSIPVGEQTRRVTIVPLEEIALCSFYAFGDGAVPNYHPWEPTPEKLDYLMIAMHPDDDVLFLGAITPIYGAQQGRTGSIFYAATRERIRKDEAQNGAWIMGLRTEPILGDFPDIPDSFRKRFEKTFLQKDIVKFLVGLIRQYRPEVVFSQDLNGEYGHWQHVRLAASVLEAVPLAADRDYDPASVEQYGVWEVKKLYLHLYPENTITLPVTQPLEAFGGRTPVEIATEAFTCHQSQLPSRHAVRNEGVYDLSAFGLAYSTVGEDTSGLNDPFEHVAPDSLHTHATPTPVPTDSPAPTGTPVPTEAPTAAPTVTPTETPEESVSPTAAMTAKPAAPIAVEEPQRKALAALPAALGAAALVCCVSAFILKKKGIKILLFVLAALLLCGGLGLFWFGQRQIPAAPDLPVASDDSLPDPDTLRGQTLLVLDLRGRTDVTPDYVDAALAALPDGAKVLWQVPLTDGVFGSDSIALTLPHFSESDAKMLRYFPDLAKVDAAGSDAYDALLALSESGVETVFTLQVGDQLLSTTDTALTVTGTPDLDRLNHLLPAFSALRALDLSHADISFEAAAAFAEAHPELAVTRSVMIGKQRFDAAAETLALSEPVDADALVRALSYFDNLSAVDLHGAVSDPDALLQCKEMFPDVMFSYAADWNGTVESNAETLDLSESADSYETVAARLALFPVLKTVRLSDTLSDAETVSQFEAAFPDVLFLHNVEVFGQTLPNDTETLDVSGMQFDSPEQVEAELIKLPRLRELVMCECGLTNEQMAALRDAHPAIKFVWMLHIAKHTLRTDAIGFSTKNPSKYTSPKATDAYNKLVKSTVRLKEGDLEPLQYCTDLEALDVGHNYLTDSDLKVLQYLPHLKILILADNRFTDISPLAQLKELMYVELFMNNIPDISPLVGLENLIDINVCNIHLGDTAPLYQFKQAERLWFSMNDISRAEIAAVAAALPDCVCNGTTRDETGDGWRDHPRYKWMRGYFADS